jgi:hypothetical protein
MRPYVVAEELEIAYYEMACDEIREQEASEWVEATVADVVDDLVRP